jgi:hypothetical protein
MKATQLAHETIASEDRVSIAEEQISSVEDQDDLIAAPARAPKRRPGRLRAAAFAMLTAQYTIIAIIVGASLASTLRYLVTPQIITKFEAITVALKR